MDKTSQIKELAREMGVTEADVRGFADCLQVWMNKGLSMEQAIERHMGQMTRLVNNAVQLATNLKPVMAGEVWEAVNA